MLSVGNFFHRVIGGLISCFGTRAAQWISNKWWEVPPPKPRAKNAAGGTQSYTALTDRKVSGSEVVASLVQTYRDKKDGFLWLRWLFVSEETQQHVRLLFKEDITVDARLSILQQVKQQGSPSCFCKIVQTMQETDFQVLRNDYKKFLINQLRYVGLKVSLNKTAYTTCTELLEWSTKLDLEGKGIDDASAQALGEALEVNQTLQSLNLKRNPIRATGAQALGVALQGNRTLQSLNLRCNQIDDAGAQALGEALRVNQTLQSLDLGYNQIGDAGAQALGEALQGNRTLQSLNLRCNQIGDAGAQVLGEALRVNQTLQSLDLGYNQISDAGAQALGEALRVNQTLQSLDLGYGPFDGLKPATKDQIDTWLQANKQMVDFFQQETEQVENFLESHKNDDGISLQDLPQLKELLQKWHTDSQNIIPSLEKILIRSGRKNLNDRYRSIVTDLTDCLHDLWLESFERKVGALSNAYVMGKKSFVERNVNLGHALYETWLTFLGSDCPNWAEDYLQSLLPFSVLLDIAEGGEKKDISELTDARSLFERVLSFKNE